MSPTPEDTPTETTETLLTEVHARLHLLGAAGPKSLDGFAISSKSKLPFKALLYREALLLRAVHIPGFRHQYDRLSEFAHPNWAGTTFLFSKIDYSTGITDFGENIRGTESTRRIGLANLSVALAMFEVSYNHITDLMPDFVQLCERHTGPDSQGPSI